MLPREEAVEARDARARLPQGPERGGRGRRRDDVEVDDGVDVGRSLLARPLLQRAEQRLPLDVLVALEEVERHRPEVAEHVDVALVEPEVPRVDDGELVSMENLVNEYLLSMVVMLET